MPHVCELVSLSLYQFMKCVFLHVTDNKKWDHIRRNETGNESAVDYDSARLWVKHETLSRYLDDCSGRFYPLTESRATYSSILIHCSFVFQMEGYDVR